MKYIASGSAPFDRLKNDWPRAARRATGEAAASNDPINLLRGTGVHFALLFGGGCAAIWMSNLRFA